MNRPFMMQIREFSTSATVFLLAALVGLGAGLGAGPGPARAAATPWIDHEQAQIRLLAGGQTAEAPEVYNLGLHFRLQPGWKIYWRAPGAAGYPPVIDWSGSQNLADAGLLWPAPHRFTLFGIETFGYSDEVVLPIDVRAERPGEPVFLRAKVGYLTCKEICIPREAEFDLALPAGPSASPSEASLIGRFRALVPGDGSNAGLRLERAVVTGSFEVPALEILARSETPFEAPDIMVEAPPGFTFDRPEIAFGEGRRTALLRVAALSAPEDVVLEGKRITLTITDGTRGMEQEVVVRRAAPTDAGAGTLIAILGLALLGGLILNLMPCVLPVLSIKLLSVVKHGGRARGEVRASFLASAAGILASFLALATAAVALKAFGMTVGWGIQFQQPLFLTAMALVVSLFAYNLFGFFEIPLPTWAHGMATIGTGGGRGPLEHGLLGHFLTGAFATLLATPCSAPFLGTALGFALARGAGEIYLIFAVLGLGLALPYLAIAAVPALAARLPRPGHWMITLRRILGLALVATALWLLSVLEAQVNLAAALGVGALLAGLGAVLWFGHATPARKIAMPALAVVLALAALALPAGLPARDGASVAAAPSADGWAPFDLTRVHALVADGKVVFVDVTADWCITCRINKKLVLDRDQVRARLDADGVVVMRGDWTLPSEQISRYLESFGRYGIPFDAVYGPAMPDGEALPELLSVDSVIDALERAAGG